jgi:5-formyltetrahydrofolate cyclo-ligase
VATGLKQKLQLRRYFREVRCQIPLAHRQAAAQAAAGFLANQAVFRASMHIACYLHVKDEFDSTPVIETIWSANKYCYLPVLTGENENSLTFVRYNSGDPLHMNRYQIPEPANITNTISPFDLDIVLTPLVAFDLRGCRLGTGGGYYDRTFSFLHGGVSRKPLIIGLAYALQQADSIPDDPWDISLDGVVTESGFMLFS